MIKNLIILALLAGIGAYFTKPTESDVNAGIIELLQEEISSGDLQTQNDPAAAVLLAACQSDATACANLARAALNVSYDDRQVYARVDVSGFGRSAVCYAAYTQVFCPNGLS